MVPDLAELADRPDARTAQAGVLLADVAPDVPSHLVLAKTPVALGAARPKARRVVRAPAATLDGGQRVQVLDTLIGVLGGAYAHLPAKRAAYAVDPVQALILLRRRATDLSDADFHLLVTGHVTGLRDGHTRYVGPTNLRGYVAALPFLVEQYGPYNDPSFLVTKVARELVDDKYFVAGVRLERLNAVPFARAVDLYAERETGGRPDARRARAMESFTFRSLDHGPPPDEDEVTIDYRAGAVVRQIRLPWRVLDPRKAATAVRPGTRAQLKIAANPAAESVRRAKKLMFNPSLWEAERDLRPAAPAPPAGALDPIETSFQDTLAARPLKNGLGYLRIWSFDVDDDDAFLAEAARLLGLLPQKGLIVDLRGNPGGLVWAAERMLQLFAGEKKRPITPTRFSLVASPLTRAMAQSPFGWSSRRGRRRWRTPCRPVSSTRSRCR
jgi:hypothetical protein